MKTDRLKMMTCHTLFVQVNHKDEDAHTFDFILFLIFMQERKVSFLELSLRKS